MAGLIAGAASTPDLAEQAHPDFGKGKAPSKRGKHKHRHLSARMRRKTATVVVAGKPKYPIPDKAHAKAALARINQAKPPLTATQKARVRKRAYTTLGQKA